MTATFQIDGACHPLTDHQTILEAARSLGIDIPTLCYDPRIGSSGACRLCVVEVEGQPRPVASCSFPLSDGLVVRTETPALRRYRRALLELVLSENPAEECPGCLSYGECDLHRLAGRYGARAGRFVGATSGRDAERDNPLIERRYSACITCYRCTRICNELEQAHAIAPSGAGFASRITTPWERPLGESGCTFCGQCVDSCPTGALVDRTRAPMPRADVSNDLGVRSTSAPDRTVRSVCGYCGVGCGVLIDIAGNRIAGVRGDADSPVNRGSLCVKGRFGWQYVHSAERLTEPLMQRNGRLEPVSWDEALDRVASGLAATRRDHGPDAAVFWSSSRATNEANYLFQKVARAGVGTNNVDNCART